MHAAAPDRPPPGPQVGGGRPQGADRFVEVTVELDVADHEGAGDAELARRPQHPPQRVR